MTTNATGQALTTSGETGRRITADHVLVATGHGWEFHRRPGDRLERLFEERCDLGPDRAAVDTGEAVLTFGELDERANRLARHLLSCGTRPGDRIGLLFDEAVHSYVAMLAVLKINAVYVPLDTGYPPDRLSYIVGDAGVRTVLSLTRLRDHLRQAEAVVLCVDEAQADVDAEPGHRLTADENGAPTDDLCYIVYTSGSTGRPKGVAIEHAAICNFVRVAVEVYGVRPDDRMYQGMTIAFDFSVEEIWVPLLSGATLVPKPSGTVLVGEDLRAFLEDRHVTAMCVVPTLLATLDRDLPRLRFLLVSGEACPQDLVLRWHRPGRRFLNVYGPTETTVTATWTPLHPDRPVTIGIPLPTYAVVILDPDEDRVLPPGEAGEIGIAGIGLARGYVNRDDLTSLKFIRDFVGIDDNPSDRIYRTGDLGRINAEGEIEYQGRIDTQVKIRGYRIELTEIESVLSQAPGVGQVVVGTHEAHPGKVELVAYYTRRNGFVDRDGLRERAREHLPPYMVPAYFEELDAIPMLPSDKADRGRLPPPTTPRAAAASNGHVAPAAGTEQEIADALVEVMRLERVSADSHFFDDLGADSLLMARLCAAIRERTRLSVSMPDVYQNPDIRSLAAVLDGTAATAVATAPEPAPDAPPPPPKPPVRKRTFEYVVCGVLQLLLFVATAYLGAAALLVGYRWTVDASGPIDLYLRGLAAGCGLFAFTCLMPVAAKWTLIGRWKPRQIRVWTLDYVRFWTVKAFIRSSPMRLLAGSPVYSLYLRMLGARIGRGAVIFSTTPVCTDLLTVGAGTIVREHCAMAGYRADDGVIRTGPITLGDRVFVGDKTVLDIDTVMGDDTQLGHASSLHAGQAVPGGERWHGCPARPTDSTYLRVPPRDCGTLRRVGYSLAQLFTQLVITGPLGIVVLITLLTEVPMLAEIMRKTPEGIGRLELYQEAAILSSLVFFGGILASLAFVLTLPRLLALIVRPDRVYRLFGRHYWAIMTTKRLTNPKFFMDLFGDSSYVVGYLRALGYRFAKPIVQTGSNFGTELAHHTPYLTTVGSGTMISDALWILNADYSSSSFKVSEVRIGSRNYLGNNIAYPAGAAVGDNVLLGTKVAVPVDGPVRENTGLLGSPCFEIPRSVERDHAFDELEKGEEYRRRLSAKNRYNIATMGLFLLVRWFQFFAVTVLLLIAEDQLRGHPVTAIVIATIGTLLFTVGYGIVVERALLRFRSLKPRICSIYDPYFWWHERLWKLGGRALFNGTPFKNLTWRMLGVRIGRRVFDDGCDIPEKTLVTIGDEATLNAGSVIQCHSLEEGVFKSGRTSIGAGCTLGVESFVHYDVTMEDGSVLATDSFLMKGEEVPPNGRWLGNPARAPH
ncbi:amino acid adenylation domain-containing protein [Actinomadura spongiicola]|uniref:Amino acid adenylation domain-containing protein n=1 Tax=Actinomadura spongiicola TaxID=2303421 RepID=A0A372GCE6_9ACTN|nr:Pls/PosA family non-ribosomal peptide synthetase [Actinomadura spongiicola]RFS82997.1 amino acid adenylation domain-containing protein [Actinomadura spongiicola]